MENDNQPQFVNIFSHPAYEAFLKNNPEAQEYWSAPMFLRMRPSDGYNEVCSNIHAGDFFGLGKPSQVGIVYNKITNIQGELDKKYQKNSPAGDGGNYLSYEIGGNIGGHWHSPTHEEFTKDKYFMWLPTPSRLHFAGFRREAAALEQYLHYILVDLNLREKG